MKPLRPIVSALLLSSFVAVAADSPAFDAPGAINQVGLDLFRRLGAGNPGGNLVLSPYSIESALALAYAGADGVTRTEMAAALHFPAETAPLQAGLASLRDDLDRIARGSGGGQARAPRRPLRGEGNNFTTLEWSVANRLVGQTGYAYRDSFLTLMRDGFAAPFEPLDFRQNPEQARGTINQWIEDQTHNKIRNLIPGGALSADTRLVLVNAIYLKAPWKKKFTAESTKPRAFHVRGGEPVDVPTMQNTFSTGYATEPGLTVVTLDYLGGDLRFLILLPDRDQPVDALAARLTPADFARWAGLGSKTPATEVNLYLPKFRFYGQVFPLGQTLRELGLKSAFDEPKGSANFDRIAPRKADDYLAISDVFHQAFVAVEEQGTEAAAATAVTMMTLAVMAQPKEPVEVHVDRPFLFAIQHTPSGACLFLGRVTDPR